MVHYTLKQNSLSQKDADNFTKANAHLGIIATQDMLHAKWDSGEACSYVIFKKHSFVPYDHVMEWGEGLLIRACWDRYHLIDRKTGKIIDPDYMP